MILAGFCPPPGGQTWHAINPSLCQHGIRPDRLALPYLEDEPPQHVVEAVGQTNEERTRPLWRLD